MSFAYPMYNFDYKAFSEPIYNFNYNNYEHYDVCIIEEYASSSILRKDNNLYCIICDYDKFDIKQYTTLSCGHSCCNLCMLEAPRCICYLCEKPIIEINSTNNVRILEDYATSLLLKNNNTCDICMNDNLKANNFVALSCGHSCCKSCMTSQVDNNNGNAKCHICRKNVIGIRLLR